MKIQYKLKVISIRQRERYGNVQPKEYSTYENYALTKCLLDQTSVSISEPSSQLGLVRDLLSPVLPRILLSQFRENAPPLMSNQLLLVISIQGLPHSAH